VRATAVEHETDEQAVPRSAEAQREDAAGPTPDAAKARPALIEARLLLGLQSRAGNAAVAQFMEQRRKPAAKPAPQPVEAAVRAPEESTQPLTKASQEAPAESSAVEPTEGGSDDDLAALDAAADAPAVDQHAASERERVAQDAQAEIADAAAPSSESDGAGGGAEPGTPVEARPEPGPKDVSSAEPSTALAQVGSLPPAQLLGSLGSVASAVDRNAAREQRQLVATPPQRPRHPGAPATVDTPASTRAAVADRPIAAAPRIAEARDVEVQKPASPAVLPEVPVPAGQLPTRDPGLDLHPGPLPRLPSEGNADPSAVPRQRGQVFTKFQQEHVAAQQDATHPLGEDHVFPTAPAETLRAALAQAPAPNGHGPTAPIAEEDQAASIIAQQEESGEIQSAVSTGLSSLAGHRQEYAQLTAMDRTKANSEMAQLEHANSQAQAVERAATKRDVAALRGQWSSEQQQLVAGAQREADAKTTETLATVAQERNTAEQQAASHYEQGQHDADQARRQAEQQAAAEKQKAQSQGIGGALGAIGSAAQGLFDKAKQAVQSVFDRARQLVRSAIERAQQLATAVVEKARQTIVAAIRVAGTALTAIGDRVLVAFPALRDRFRRLIQDRIAAAEAAVNKLSSALKEAVQRALNVLGAALTTAIGLMRSGMRAALDLVRSTVRGALDFARGAISVLGTFAALVKDVAANPGQWISNLAAAARDGIKNHLWPALKAAVQAWFSDKVEAVLGLGSAVWNLLRRGGITLIQIAHVAWEGIKSTIPQTIIWVLIEKLVSLIVPAAAAVMLIIQALQAAWSSIGRIIQAFDAFMAFLKGVRWGNAGPLFGKALAAGAVAVIEFISQFLLQRLMGAAGAVAGKLRLLAKRIGARLAAAGRGIVRGAKWVGGKIAGAGRGLKGFARPTIARPQARWHAWRLGRVLRRGHPQAFEKLRQVRSDPGLDPRLKLQFLKSVRSRLGPGADPRKVMTKVVEENEEVFCRQGRALTSQEIASAAPMTKLVSLADVFDRHMLVESYQKQFVSFSDWRVALAKDPALFDPKVHLKPDAPLGRWWSPLADTNEPTLELAVETRQLSADYAHGAIRAHMLPEEAAKTKFYKPTALDAMFFDPWQPPPSKASWGFIKTQDGEVVIREAVTKPVTTSACSVFETLLPGGSGPTSAASGALVEAIETLP
jgi:hypothetical protein